MEKQLAIYTPKGVGLAFNAGDLIACQYETRVDYGIYRSFNENEGVKISFLFSVHNSTVGTPETVYKISSDVTESNEQILNSSEIKYFRPSKNEFKELATKFLNLIRLHLLETINVGIILTKKVSIPLLSRNDEDFRSFIKDWADEFSKLPGVCVSIGYDESGHYYEGYDPIYGSPQFAIVIDYPNTPEAMVADHFGSHERKVVSFSELNKLPEIYEEIHGIVTPLVAKKEDVFEEEEKS